MKTNLIRDIAWGAGIIVLALVASYARHQGLIDGAAVTRLIMGATGLVLAAFGNRMPKAWAPSESARQVTRVGGWSLAVSGLIYAALWALAPFDVALWGGCAVLILGIAVTMTYCVSVARRAHRASKQV